MKRRDDAPMPEDCADTLASSDEETQNSGSAEERSAEKYIFLKLGSGGNTGGTPTKGAVADEEETRSSVTGGDGGSRQSLRLLGMQIRELELECEREADTAVKEWKLTQYPMYRATVREIEKAVSALEDQIKKESNVSEEHVLSLEETLKAHVDVLNATKKRMYFPNSNLSSGSADAFFAIDDFWVEDVSGVFVVDMIGSLSSPQVIVNLTGTADGPNSGVNVKLKLEGFKLRAKGAPSISVQETVLTACVKMSMMLTFVAASNKWQLLPADFRLDLLAFSGPYGLSRAFVSTILSMVGGKIREAILVALPMEVGHLLMTLPIPFAVRGEFAVRGTPLSLLCSPLDEAQGLCQSLGFNPGHMKVFMELQKKIGRGARGGPLLKTMQDMINYRTMGAKNSKLWEKLVKLWNNAATVFIEMKVEEVAAAAFAAPVGEGSGEKGIGSSHLFGYNTNAVTVLATFSFDDIVQAVEDVMRKPLSIEFKLHHISGQVSVNQVIDKLRRLAHRLALISAKVGKNTTRGANDDIFMDKRVSALLKRATREFDDAKKVLGILAQNFDYGQVLADVHMKSGAAGDITVRASQILGRAPISIWLNLPQRLAFLGIHCPVPYVMALKTDPEGNMVIEFNHVGSSKTTRRGVFMRHEDAKDRSQNKVRVRARRRSINWRAQWASKLSEKKVKALDEESKFHLSPLISISDSYTLPTETHLDDITMRESFSLMDGDHIRGKLSSSFSKLSSKMKSVVPMMPRKKVIDEAVPNLAATSHSAVKSSNIFIVPTKHANNVAKQIFTDVPVTAADFDDDEDDNLEEEVDEERELENESADESQSQGAVESTSDIATNAVDVNTENQPEVYSPSKPRTSIPVLRSYRRKARLEQTLGAVPKEDEVVEVASAIVYKPKVTIVTEKAVSLRAGAELLTFSLGKTSAAGVGDSEVHIESIVTPTFREREQSATAPTVMLTAASLKIKRDMKNEENYDAVSVSNASVSDSERVTDASWTEDKTAIDEYKNSGLDVPEYRRNVIGEADGSPVVVQTGTGIKVLVEVLKSIKFQ